MMVAYKKEDGEVVSHVGHDDLWMVSPIGHENFKIVDII